MDWQAFVDNIFKPVVEWGFALVILGSVLAWIYEQYEKWKLKTNLHEEGYKYVFKDKDADCFVAFNVDKNRVRWGSVHGVVKEASILDIQKYKWQKKDITEDNQQGNSQHKIENIFVFQFIDTANPPHEINLGSAEYIYPQVASQWTQIEEIIQAAKSFSTANATEKREPYTNLQPTLSQPTPATTPLYKHDVFICHASEDKDVFVRPLAEALTKKGLNVWYDEYKLRIGMSLRRSIDKGLDQSRFGLVVLSHSFFSKDWPQRELDALFATMNVDNARILPVWHNVTAEEVQKYSPLLADILAARSSDGIDDVVHKVVEACQEAT
jgi:hypothetical protein